MYLLMAKNIVFILFPLVFLFSSCEKRRTPISYELPKDYTGWVTVKFEKKNAPRLQNTSGSYYIKISDDGFAETSSKVEEGWATDEYYWMDNGRKVYLTQNSGENTANIHAESYHTMGFQNFVSPDTLEVGKEVTLPDGGKVTRLDNKGGVKFESGRYLLYTFYVTKKLEDMWDFPNNHLPPISKEHETW
jgi:hypothetical protein